LEALGQSKIALLTTMQTHEITPGQIADIADPQLRAFVDARRVES